MHMKLLILLITSALLGCSLASPLERQELVDEVLEALAQESNERELADIESNQLVDAESDDELADMEDDDEELEDEANEQDLDSVLEALAQVMDLEELADIESEDELAEIEDDDEEKLADTESDYELANMDDESKELADVEDNSELAYTEDDDQEELANAESSRELADIEDDEQEELVDTESDKLADIEDEDEEELADVEGEEDLAALVQEYLDQLEAKRQSTELQAYKVKNQFFRRAFKTIKRGVKKGVSFAGKAFKKAKDIARKIWKYRGLVKCIPRNFNKRKRAQITQKAIQCVIRELKKHPKEVAVQFISEIADQAKGEQLTSADLQDAMIAAVASSVEAAEQLQQVAMETESEEATVAAKWTKYYKKAKRIVRKLMKYKKYYPCVKNVSSRNTSKAVNCVVKKMNQGKKSSPKRTRRPTFLEDIINQVSLQDFKA